MKLFFSHSKSMDPFSNIIKWATNSQWTHCGLILDSTLAGEVVVAECAWDHGGVALDLWEQKQFMAFEVYEFDALELAQVNFIRNTIAIRYAYAKIVLFGIAAIFGQPAMQKVCSFLAKLGLWDDPWKDGMWCSEFVYAFVSTIPDLVSISKDSDSITPEDLHVAVKDNPKFKLVASN